MESTKQTGVQMAREWGLECTVSREAVEKPVGRGTGNAASPVQQGDLVREKPKKYKQERGAVPTPDSSQYLQAFDKVMHTCTSQNRTISSSPDHKDKNLHHMSQVNPNRSFPQLNPLYLKKTWFLLRIEE